MIFIQQDGKMLGPHCPTEVRRMLTFQRARPADTFAWAGAREWLGYADFKPLLRLLEDDDVIVDGDRDFVITPHRLISKTRAWRREEIVGIALVIPENPKGVAGDMRRNLLWGFAVVFCWTFVIPLAVWFINKKSMGEEGLGAVCGIRLAGAWGETIIKDSMGIPAADDPRRGELAEACRILTEWKAGHSPAPVAEVPQAIPEVAPLPTVPAENPVKDVPAQSAKHNAHKC